MWYDMVGAVDRFEGFSFINKFNYKGQHSGRCCFLDLKS